MDAASNKRSNRDRVSRPGTIVSVRGHCAAPPAWLLCSQTTPHRSGWAICAGSAAFRPPKRGHEIAASTEPEAAFCESRDPPSQVQSAPVGISERRDAPPTRNLRPAASASPSRKPPRQPREGLAGYGSVFRLWMEDCAWAKYYRSFTHSAAPPACSNAWASCKIRDSPKAGPKSCKPTGSFPQILPQGTEMPGTPASEPVTV